MIRSRTVFQPENALLRCRFRHSPIEPAGFSSEKQEETVVESMQEIGRGTGHREGQLRAGPRKTSLTCQITTSSGWDVVRWGAVSRSITQVLEAKPANSLL